MAEGPKRIHGQHHGSRGAGRKPVRRGQSPPPAAEHGREKAGFPFGMVVMAVAGLLFVCYLTNAGDVQTGIDSFFNAQVRSAHQHDAAVTTWFMLLLPYVIMAMGIAVLYVVLASFGVGKTRRKPQPPTEELTIHQFAELAGAAGVGARVAREMYRMLLPSYAATMRTTLTQPFAELNTPAEAVWEMFELLVERSGGVICGNFGVEALGTPTEMMQAAERCVERAALERRARLQKTAALAEEQSRSIIPLPAGAQQ